MFSVLGFEVGPWVFALLAAGGVAWEVGRLWLAIRSDFWPFVVGTIEQAEIESRLDSDGDEQFVPVMKYRYTVAGDWYEGSRVTFSPQGSARHEAIAEAMAGVNASRPHRVYYHPRYPELSVLKPGAGLVNYVVIGFLFVILCIAIHAQTHA